MPAKRYTVQFANQFRQDYLVYTSSKEKQYEHLMVHQFAGSEQEPEWLAKRLTQTIHDVPLIGRMIGIMERDAMPQAVALAEYTETLKQLFSTRANDEPYASTYYSNLVLAVTDLHDQAITFQKDTCEHLLNKLKMPFVTQAAPGRVLDIDSDTIRKIDDVIEYYLDNFDAYDNYFHSLIRQEREHEKRVSVTSEVIDHLSKLVRYTDALVNFLQSTREILFAWEMQLAGREVQELYN